MNPQVFHPEDGSTLIEWVSKDYRFGISFEEILGESGWFFVVKGGESWSGPLPKELLDLWYSEDSYDNSL